MIRKALSTDFTSIAAINDKVQTLPWSHESLKSELTHEDFIGFVHLGESGHINGYILAREHCDGADIMIVGVETVFQRRGAGRALVEAVISEIKKCEPPKEAILLEVSSQNHKAISLYEKMGFKTYLLRRSYYSDGTDALCMKLGLAKTQ